MKAYQITGGLSPIFAETPEDAELVAREIRWGSRISGKNYPVNIEEVEVDEIPQEDREYIDWLRN